jgi:hypothetical protein
MLNTQATGQINVKRLLLAETGRYDNQLGRPWQTSLQGETLNTLSNRLAGNTRFAASQLAGIANQIVSPSASPESQLIIPQGWGERRLRFMMEVECRMLAGGVTNIMVLGYTNHIGVAPMSGALDPNMEFYVNSVIALRHQPEQTPAGIITNTSIIENSHVLVNQSYAGVYSNTQSYKMRPEDVYAAQKVSHITAVADVLDARTVLDSKPIASRRGNAVATSYAAQLLDGYSRANLDQNFGVNKEEDILEGARGYVQEGMVQNNAFFRAISNYRDGFMANWFTWNDLCKLDPTTDHRTAVAMLGQTTLSQTPLTAYDVQGGGACPWTGSDRETLVATILSQSIPALMTDYGLTKIAFSTTNRRLFNDVSVGLGPFSQQSRISTTITDFLSFADFDASRFMDHFKGRIEQMVMMDISFNNEMDFYVTMEADLLGETWIRLSLNGGPEILFVTPSFADALMTPVVTQSSSRAAQLSADFQVIFNEVASHAAPGYDMGGAPMQFVPDNAFGNV